MKKTMFVALISLLSLNSFAAEYRVQKVKTLGVMKHEVIFQSKDLKKVRGTNVLKGKIVAQWGLHVFEVANGFYACNKNNFCKLTDFETIATFEKCTVKKSKVECRKRLSGEASTVRGDVLVQEDVDSARDEFSPSYRSEDDLNEFPVRVKDEFDGIF